MRGAANRLTRSEIVTYLEARLAHIKINEVIARGPCPLCESDTFMVNLRNGCWHCSGCQRHGDSVDLEMRLTAREAVLRLVGRTPGTDQVPQQTGEPAGGEESSHG
jgi:ribosomal protein L37AE/L43A